MTFSSDTTNRDDIRNAGKTCPDHALLFESGRSVVNFLTNFEADLQKRGTRYLLKAQQKIDHEVMFR